MRSKYGKARINVTCSGSPVMFLRRTKRLSYIHNRWIFMFWMHLKSWAIKNLWVVATTLELELLSVETSFHTYWNRRGNVFFPRSHPYLCCHIPLRCSIQFYFPYFFDLICFCLTTRARRLLNTSSAIRWGSVGEASAGVCCENTRRTLIMNHNNDKN